MTKRELIELTTDDKRDVQGRFADQVDIGKSLAADRRQRAKHVAGPGHGDRGDHEAG